MDWLVVVEVFCGGLRSWVVEDSQVSERLQSPDRSLLQSGREAFGLAVRLDVKASLSRPSWGTPETQEMELQEVHGVGKQTNLTFLNRSCASDYHL